MTFASSLMYAQVPTLPEVSESLDPLVIEKIQESNNPSNTIQQEIDQEQTVKKKEELQKEKDEQDEDKKIKFDLRQKALPEAKIWGQQFFRDQSISLFTRSRDIKALDSYLLGVGDEITITIWGATDYSASVALDEEGFITLTNPARGVHIPRLYLIDMKFSDAKKAIIERLENHVNMSNSQISIELNYSRSLTVNITGEVFNPGSYTFPAVNTAFNALVASGGPSQIGSVRKIKVISSEKETRLLDVYRFMNDPKVSDEFFMSNNDYIFVPLAERIVEIQGSVERPFNYELVENEQLSALIDYAGGLKPDAYTRNIQIIRYVNNEERLIDLDLDKLTHNDEDFELIDGDRVVINPIKQAFSNYVNVKGAVKLPGTYELEKNLTIRDLLMKAGIIQSAVMERIYVKRLREDLTVDYIDVNVFNILEDPTSDQNIKLYPFDEIEVKYKSEFIDKYNIKVFGSVRNPGEFEYSDSLTLADLLYMANGITKEASNSFVEISRLNLDEEGNGTHVLLEKLEISGLDDGLVIEGATNYYLQPNDMIFVRKSNKYKSLQNINISGQVEWPGQYTLQYDGETLLELLNRAGGCSDVAFLEGSKFTRQGDGEIILDLEDLLENGKNSIYNYKLRGGDRIHIPMVKDIVSIAGFVNHSKLKEDTELHTKELEIRLLELEDNIQKQKLIFEEFKNKKEHPIKVNMPFISSKSAKYYVEKFGAGIDRKNGGRNRLIYVKYANGMVKNTKTFMFFKKYPKVEKGAMVYVDAVPPKVKKERNPLNWYKLISDVLALGVSGLTIYALINTLKP